MNLRRFLSLFAAPSRFADDPYGHLTNQVSHAMLGFASATVFAWIAQLASGQWLDQRVTFAVVTLGYFVWWELIFQRWRGLDTVEDSVFVALGAAAYLAIDMSYVIERVMLWLVALGVLLVPGVLLRWRARGER